MMHERSSPIDAAGKGGCTADHPLSIASPPFEKPCILHDDLRSVLATMTPPHRRIFFSPPGTRRDNGCNFPLVVSSFSRTFKSKKRRR